jgi:hypothetical protein
MTPPRTVYILGAGFSAPFGLPAQAGILDLVLDQPDSRFQTEREEVRRFITDAFQVRAEDCSRVSLEDIYTVLDRAYAARDTVAGLKGDQLLDLQGKLNLLIAAAFESADKKEHRESLKAFVDVLANYARRRGKSSDPFALISLNWDIVLDHALYQALQELSDEPKGRGVLDYGMYFHSLRGPKETRVLNGTMGLKFGAPTIKLLKLHASMNWLYCPDCERMYVQPGRKLMLDRAVCSCGNDALRPMLISPTFLKSLENMHLRNVWHLAGVKLREAQRVVFIGYSLPQADFELRYLLQRHLSPDARVEVVNYLNPQAEEAEHTRQELEARYKYLLGKRVGNAAFHYDGTVAFLERETGVWR